MRTINRPPGVLSYSGEYKNEPISIDVYAYDEKSWLHKTYDAIKDIPLTKENTWINIIGLHDIKILKAIEERFKVNPFILEDIVQVSTNSKIETLEHYTFSIFKMLYLQDDIIKHEHVSIIKMDNVIITFQETAGDVFNSTRRTIEENTGIIRQSSIEFLYYRLLDNLIDQYFEILPYINTRIEALEYDILEDKRATLEGVYGVRKELLLIKNSVFPLKLILQNFLNKNTITFQAHYDDLIDHLDQIYESVNLYRELVNSLYDTHMSNQSHKMNRTMTTLAIFSAIFIPLSFLAGFFGMNFEHFPSLSGTYSLYVFIAACFVIGGGMLGIFKYKKII